MRRLAGLLALCLLLAGCGADRSWRFAPETWYDTDDYLAGDSGKLIAWYELELPRLKLESDRAAPAPPRALQAHEKAPRDLVARGCGKGGWQRATFPRS